MPEIDLGSLLKKAGSLLPTEEKRQRDQLTSLVTKINGLEPEFVSLDEESLKSKTAEFKTRYHNGEPLDQILPEAFAVVRAAGNRILGMRHFDVQLMGGIVLHQGKIAEMQTGEGKTLTA